MDIQAALALGCGKSLEIRKELPARGAALETLVGFANTSGGTFLIGLDPATGSVRGVADPLALAERLEQWAARGIQPRLLLDVEVLTWRQLQLLAVRVHPGAQRPYCIRDAGLAAGVMVRVGAENRAADPALVEELRRHARGIAHDEEPCTDLEANALDGTAMERAFQKAGTMLRGADLRELHLLMEFEGRLVPTVGGVLLFGGQRLERFPDAWIQAGRFAGSDRSTVLDAAEMRGDLPSAVEEAMAFALRNLTRSSAIDGLRRADEYALPPVALREALVNAVVHADYSQRGAPIRLAIHDDRVEITSPGLLPLGLTLQDLDHGVSKLRNRVLGRVFHALRLVEQWGSGIARMRRSMQDAGLPSPQLAEVGLSFRAVLGTRRTGPPSADSKDELILDALASRGPMSTSEVAALVELSDRATRTRLKNLVERGAAVEIGSGPNDPHRKYAVLQRRGRQPQGER